MLNETHSHTQNAERNVSRNEDSSWPLTINFLHSTCRVTLTHRLASVPGPFAVANSSEKKYRYTSTHTSALIIYPLKNFEYSTGGMTGKQRFECSERRHVALITCEDKNNSTFFSCPPKLLLPFFSLLFVFLFTFIFEIERKKNS